VGNSPICGGDPQCNFMQITRTVKEMEEAIVNVDNDIGFSVDSLCYFSCRTGFTELESRDDKSTLCRRRSGTTLEVLDRLADLWHGP